MADYNQILQIIGGIPSSFTIDEIEVENAEGYILQEDIFADMDMPPFNKSAVDGYACRKEDLGEEMIVVEFLQAGSAPGKHIGPKECMKIMTGAAVPEGADMVFMIEDAETLDENWVRCMNPNSKSNICILGEDNRSGDLLVPKGSILRAEHLAVSAGAGKTKLRVSRPPRVGFIVTGSELVEPSETPAPGMIRNTNAVQIISLLKNMKLEPTYYGLVPDKMDILLSVFRKAREENEVIILTGGAAVGDFDLIPELINKEGYETLWTRTGLKPGNPMSFSMKDSKYILGLSGNPVSSLVQFEYLARPVIYKLMGANYKPVRITGIAGHDISRKNDSRLGIFPARINEEGCIDTVPFNGSAHIQGFTGANVLLELPVGVKKINKGEMVYVRPL